jgi:glycosyltransferase involved in cell wall biosynthesis
LVVLEALAQGTPCVCVDVMGPGETLRDGKGGLLAEPNPADLARQILAMEQDPALLRRKGREALDKAREYDIHALARRLVGYYQEVIDQAKAAQRQGE